jgi:peptidoglycan hydrolase-like protein with peptidoglycan-binding domain
MKKLLLLIAMLAGLMAVTAGADETVRAVQDTLKKEGFYYGDVDGLMGEETRAAIRRYQIRYGLKVSGEMSHETLDQLGLRGRVKAPTYVGKPKDEASPPPRSTPEPGHRTAARRSVARTQPRAAATPAPRATPKPTPATSGKRRTVVRTTPAYSPLPERTTVAYGGRPLRGYPLGTLFYGTPYERAPLPVMRDLVLNAQRFLKSRGYYRADIDGIVGAGTRNAITDFQAANRFPLTGRLDSATLGAMGLLPVPAHHPQAGPPMEAWGAPPPPRPRWHPPGSPHWRHWR